MRRVRRAALRRASSRAFVPRVSTKHRAKRRRGEMCGLIQRQDHVVAAHPAPRRAESACHVIPRDLVVSRGTSPSGEGPRDLALLDAGCASEGASPNPPEGERFAIASPPCASFESSRSSASSCETSRPDDTDHVSVDRPTVVHFRDARFPTRRLVRSNPTRRCGLVDLACPVLCLVTSSRRVDRPEGCRTLRWLPRLRERLDDGAQPGLFVSPKETPSVPVCRTPPPDASSWSAPAPRRSRSPPRRPVSPRDAPQRDPLSRRACPDQSQRHIVPA